MANTADVIIVGAGVIGLCTALQLIKRSTLKVVILESANSLGQGSTGASSAVCRHLYSHDELICLARDGINIYRDWQRFLDIETQAKFQETGVLWLGSDAMTLSEKDSLRLNERSIAAKLIDDEELKARFPAINPCPLSPDFETGLAHNCSNGHSHLLELEAGYIDPQYVLEDLKKALERHGTTISFGKQVVSVETEHERVIGVRCADGEQYFGKHVINASGPWCNDLLEQVGLANTWPLKPTRIQILYFDRPSEIVGDLPAFADIAGGIYFRHQNRGQQFIVGSTLAEDETEVIKNPNSFNRLADDTFINTKLHALHHRLPDLPFKGRVKGYAGLYTINQSDLHPIVGKTPVDGFIVANGFSGHGFKLAPAIGALIAQEITGERIEGETSVSIDFFRWDRTPIALSTKSVLA